MAQRRGQQYQQNQSRNQPQGRGNGRDQRGPRGGTPMPDRSPSASSYGINESNWSGQTWNDEPSDFGGGYGQSQRRSGDYGNDWESERSYNEPEYAPGLGEPGWRTQGNYSQGNYRQGMGQRGYGQGGMHGRSGYGQGSYGWGSHGESRGQHAGKGPKGYQRSDDRIREEISDELTDHPDIDASDVELEVKNGEVTITGTVDSREAKRMTEDIAEQSSGVTHVSNQLRISNGSSRMGSSEDQSSSSTSGRSSSSSGSSSGRRGSR